jgi:hypothetical protein
MASTREERRVSSGEAELEGAAIMDRRDTPANEATISPRPSIELASSVSPFPSVLSARSPRPPSTTLPLPSATLPTSFIGN